MQRPVSPLLTELEDRARRDGVAIIDRALGRLLSTLVHCMQANRIVEVGTGYGYATLWMSTALPPAGKVWSIDSERERARVAQEYFGRSGGAKQIEIVNSPALDILPRFPLRNLDIVFVDADRAQYAAYLQHALPLMKLSGLVLFHGMDDIFAQEFLSRPELDATLLPLGEGTGIGARIR